MRVEQAAPPPPAAGPLNGIALSLKTTQQTCLLQAQLTSDTGMLPGEARPCCGQARGVWAQPAAFSLAPVGRTVI